MTKKKKIKIDDFINEEVENIETQIEKTEEPIIEEVIEEPIIEEVVVKTPEPEVEEIISEPVVEEKIKEEVKTLSQADSRMMRRMGK